jgi:hypothetical protein
MAPVPVLVPSCAVSPHAVAQSCRHIFVLLLSRLLQLAHEHLASPCKNVVPFKRAAWHPVPVPVPGSAHLLPHVVAHSLSLHCVATQLHFVAVSASRSRFSCNVSPSVCCLAPVHGAVPSAHLLPHAVAHSLSAIFCCYSAASLQLVRRASALVRTSCLPFAVWHQYMCPSHQRICLHAVAQLGRQIFCAATSRASLQLVRRASSLLHSTASPVCCMAPVPEACPISACAGVPPCCRPQLVVTFSGYYSAALVGS